MPGSEGKHTHTIIYMSHILYIYDLYICACRRYAYTEHVCYFVRVSCIVCIVDVDVRTRTYMYV